MRTSTFCLAAVLTGLTAAAAEAGTGRIVVMPFDGPRELADDTRTAVVTEISRNHDVVAPTTWVKARRTADKHELGEKAWAQAAKRAKVDAVIEGKVVKRGGKATLELTVVDAHEGTEIDRVEIQMPGKGVGRDAEQRVRTELMHMLDWVDGVAVTRRVGGEDLSELEELQDLDGDEASDDDDMPRPRRKKKEKVAEGERDDDEERDEREAREDDDDRDRDRDERDEDDDDDAPPASDRGDDLVALFGDDGASPADGERRARRAAKAAAGARMFAASAGAVAFSRTFTFQGGADAPADYPGGVTKGVALAAELYPMSTDPTGKFSGFGVSLDYARGLGSSVEVGDDEVWDDFPIIYQEWSAAAHYRHNTPKVGIDGSLGYRSITHVLDAESSVAAEDMGAELDALDGEYGAITAGARLDFAAGPRATVGLSAQYLYVTSVGVISDATILGSGQAWGARAGADLLVTLSRSAYLTAAVTHQRVDIEFDGSGDMDADWEVDTTSDTFTGAQVGVGIKY